MVKALGTLRIGCLAADMCKHLRRIPPTIHVLFKGPEMFVHGFKSSTRVSCKAQAAPCIAHVCSSVIVSIQTDTTVPALVQENAFETVCDETWAIPVLSHYTNAVMYTLQLPVLLCHVLHEHLVGPS